MVTVPLAALAGLLIAVGALGVVSSERPSEPPPGARVADSVRRGIAVAPRRLVGAAGAALAVLLVTHWPVAAAGAGAAVYLFLVRRARPTAAQEIERTEAIAAWAEMLRDGVGTPRGVEGIITATASTSPELIRAVVMRFAHQLGWQDLHDALPQLAADLDHPIGDLIVIALHIASSSGARQVRAVLDDLAAAAREEARMLRRQEVARERPRSELRQV